MAARSFERRMKRAVTTLLRDSNIVICWVDLEFLRFGWVCRSGGAARCNDQHKGGGVKSISL